MPLFYGLGKVVDGAGGVAQLGDGAGQPRLAISDQPLVIGLGAQRFLRRRPQRKDVDEHGG